MSELASLRLDKWLWAARFFKTRALATEAVAGGKVHLNGSRCKPGKEVKVSDKLTVNKDGYEWEVTVLALNEQRRPAAEAVLLYEESADSKLKREQQRLQDKEQRSLVGYIPPSHKPNKKDRRLIHRFKSV